MLSRFIFSTFSPSEAEAITGLSTTMQRDWRRRGFLPPEQGHARFDVFSLAQIMAMRALAERGIGPAQSKDVAAWCAPGICWQALAQKNAYEGDHERTFDWLPEELRPARELDLGVYEKLAAAAKDEGIPFPAREDWDFGWEHKSLWLRTHLLKLKGCPADLAEQFLIWWADGSHVFHNSVDDAYGELPFRDPRTAGPVIVLPLRALGSNLIGRAGRPLVHVEFPQDEETGDLVGEPSWFGVTVPYVTGDE